MPAGGEEAGNETPAARVLAGDGGDTGGGRGAVEEENRDAGCLALLREVRGQGRRGEDDAVDPVADDLVEKRVGGVAGVGGEQEDVVAALLQPRRHHLQHVEVEVVLEVGVDEAYHA